MLEESNSFTVTDSNKIVLGSCIEYTSLAGVWGSSIGFAWTLDLALQYEPMNTNKNTTIATTTIDM